MIEVIYKEEKQEGADIVSVPRNIRQIGFISGDCRIYIEDYVYTFLGRTASSEKILGSKEGCAAVLTGEMKWQEGITYVFVKGAILAKNMEAAREHIDFSEEIWADVHEAQKKYFENQEVVGWFFAQPECPVAATEIFTKAHVKNFGGEKVLMLMEPVEREDGFFRYENGNLVRQRGYYIYYEKNPQMQAYMIDNNSDMQMENAEETGDDTVKNIRKIINGKKKEDGADKPEKQEEKTSVFSYAATAVLAAAVFAVGVNFYQDYREVKQDAGETAQVSSVIEAKTEKKKENIKPLPTSAPAATPVLTEKPSETTVGEKQEPRTVTPEITASPVQETDGSSVYREESDIRKAKRREALEQQEESEQTEQNISERKIPEQKDSVSEETAAGTEESYVIRPGDTLYQISVARYGSTDAIEEICRLNGLSEQEIIYPGQIIVLP